MRSPIIAFASVVVRPTAADWVRDGIFYCKIILTCMRLHIAC